MSSSLVEEQVQLSCLLAYNVDMLTLKAPITTAAGDTFFHIFPNFVKNKV